MIAAIGIGAGGGLLVAGVLLLAGSSGDLRATLAPAAVLLLLGLALVGIGLADIG